LCNRKYPLVIKEERVQPTLDRVHSSVYCPVLLTKVKVTSHPLSYKRNIYLPPTLLHPNTYYCSVLVIVVLLTAIFQWGIPNPVLTPHPHPMKLYSFPSLYPYPDCKIQPIPITIRVSSLQWILIPHSMIGWGRDEGQEVEASGRATVDAS
jgi:hypothetical protein